MANHTGTMKKKNNWLFKKNGQTRILQSLSLVSMGKCVIWMHLVSIVRDVKVFGSKTGWDVQCTMMRMGYLCKFMCLYISFTRTPH